MVETSGSTDSAVVERSCVRKYSIADVVAAW